MSNTAELLDRCRNVLDTAVSALENAQLRVVKKLEGADEYDEKLGSHLAWTAAKVAEITTSLRQLEKHDRTQGKSPAQQFILIKAWLTQQATQAQRAEVAALLADVAEQRSVLS